MASLSRYFLEFFRSGSAHIEVSETTYARSDETLAATVYRAPGHKRAPAWVVLHGLTAPGRHHPSITRFARSVAASGQLVFVPDIPEWRNLQIDTAAAAATIKAAVNALHARSDVDTDHVRVMGFSMGATQGLIAAAQPEVDRLLSGVAAWGGYSDIRRIFIYTMTGVHELDGVRYHAQPDPYGRWISVARYLTAVPGYEDAGDVANALHTLALEVGRTRVYADDPAIDPFKREVRERVQREHRHIFDTFAPPARTPPTDDEPSRALAHALADAALEVDPLLNPGPVLDRLTTPVLIAHGRDDRSLPFTESIRLARALPPELVRSCTVTGLFAHSGGTVEGIGIMKKAREAVRLVRLINDVLNLP